LAFVGQPAHNIDAQHLTIEVGPEAETCLVRLVGELDMATVPAVEAELNRLLSSALQTIVVDLGDLAFIDSTGLACLMKATKRSAEDGSRLRILRGSEQVMRVMRITGVDEVLPLID
jgi:anti-sigma B factor antagonist